MRAIQSAGWGGWDYVGDKRRHWNLVNWPILIRQQAPGTRTMQASSARSGRGYEKEEGCIVKPCGYRFQKTRCRTEESKFGVEVSWLTPMLGATARESALGLRMSHGTSIVCRSCSRASGIRNIPVVVGLLPRSGAGHGHPMYSY